MSKIYTHRPEESQVITWTRRIAATVLVLPFVLALIVDLGRNLANYLNSAPKQLPEQKPEDAKSQPEAPKPQPQKAAKPQSVPSEKTQQRQAKPAASIAPQDTGPKGDQTSPRDAVRNLAEHGTIQLKLRLRSKAEKTTSSSKTDGSNTDGSSVSAQPLLPKTRFPRIPAYKFDARSAITTDAKIVGPHSMVSDRYGLFNTDSSGECRFRPVQPEDEILDNTSQVRLPNAANPAARLIFQPLTFLFNALFGREEQSSSSLPAQ